MKVKQMTLGIILVLVSLTMAESAWAGGIKERMKQRLPAIVALKTQGVVGENNQGYLAFVGGQTAREDLVAAENRDRKIIYSKIASQQNTSLDLVEKRRALQLFQRAKPGEFVQKQTGAWIKK